MTDFADFFMDTARLMHEELGRQSRLDALLRKAFRAEEARLNRSGSSLKQPLAGDAEESK